MITVGGALIITLVVIALLGAGIAYVLGYDTLAVIFGCGLVATLVVSFLVYIWNTALTGGVL